MFEADETLYLTADGRIVGEGDVEAHTLLVAAGGRIPLELAERHGLVEPLNQPTHKALFMGKVLPAEGVRVIVIGGSKRK